MKSGLAATLLAIATVLPIKVQAAEINVITPSNMKEILTDLTAPFEKLTGNKLVITYAPPGAVKAKVLAGDTVDVAITVNSRINDLVKDGMISSDSVVDVGRSSIAVAVRKGAPKPDISSLDAFKRSLLSARSIGYNEPAQGGIAGIYFAALLDRLGLADQMKAKTKLVAPGAPAIVAAIANGDVEIGVSQLSAFVGNPDLDVVGILPKDFGVDIVMSAGVIVSTKQPDAAAAFVKFLTSPAAVSVIKVRGMEPGS